MQDTLPHCPACIHTLHTKMFPRVKTVQLTIQHSWFIQKFIPRSKGKEQRQGSQRDTHHPVYISAAPDVNFAVLHIQTPGCCLLQVSGQRRCVQASLWPQSIHSGVRSSGSQAPAQGHLPALCCCLLDCGPVPFPSLAWHTICQHSAILLVGQPGEGWLGACSGISIRWTGLQIKN